MFESRATATEFLDCPDCDSALAAASYRFMERVNGRFGGARVVRRFLAAETAERRVGVPLRILDIGSGSCDIPLTVSRWARAHDIPVHFTCRGLHVLSPFRRRPNPHTSAETPWFRAHKCPDQRPPALAIGVSGGKTVADRYADRGPP